jgi:hypothetical protein
LTGTNGLFARRLISWIVRATTSLPVPVSPTTNTGGVGRRHARHRVVDLLHRGRRADQLAEAAEARSSSRSGLDLDAQVPRARDVREDRAQAGNLDRLAQVVGHAAAQRLDRRLDGGETGDQDDLGVRHQVLGLGRGDEVEPRAVRQVEVEQKDVRPRFRSRRARLGESRALRVTSKPSRRTISDRRRGRRLVFYDPGA